MRPVQYRVPMRRVWRGEALTTAAAISATCLCSGALAVYLTAQAYCARPGERATSTAFGVVAPPVPGPASADRSGHGT